MSCKRFELFALGPKFEKHFEFNSDPVLSLQLSNLFSSLRSAVAIRNSYSFSTKLRKVAPYCATLMVAQILKLI